MKTLLAIVKFNPVAVARSDNNKIIASLESLNVLIIFSLLSAVIDPVILSVFIELSLNIFSMNSIMLIHCVKTRIFCFFLMRSFAYSKIAASLELISILRVLTCSKISGLPSTLASKRSFIVNLFRQDGQFPLCVT